MEIENMKSRTAPTSIKSIQSASTRDGAGHNYETPIKKNGNVVVYIIVAVVIGFLSGFVGTIAFLRWGNNIPFVSNLSYIVTEPGLIIRSYNRDEELREQAIIRLNENIQPTQVGLYRTDEVNGIAIEGVVNPESFLGWGTMLTNDGVGVTVDEIEVTTGLVAKQNNEEPLPVTIHAKDEAHGLVYFSLPTNFSTVADITSPTEQIVTGEEVFSYHSSLLGISGGVFTHIVSSLAYSDNLIDTIIHSSEQLPKPVLISTAGPMIPGTPIVKRDGRIIGLMRGDSDAGMMIIGADIIERHLSQVLQDREVTLPYLGVNYIDLSEDDTLASSLGVNRQAGAYVYPDKGIAVKIGSPAENAKIVEDDIIIRVDNVLLSGDISLADLIKVKDPGEKITLTIIRGNEEMEITVTLIEQS